jgi:hypothetical protein
MYYREYYQPTFLAQGFCQQVLTKETNEEIPSAD